MPDPFFVGSNYFFGGGNLLLTGTSNVGIGDGAARSLTTGTSNTGLGSEALRDVSNGAYNTAIGTAALRVLVSGSDNVAIGASAERANTTGIGNIVVGASAGLARTSGDYNVCIGTGAMSSVTNGGVNNIAIGRSAMLAYPGDDAVGVGPYALSNVTGARNTAVGARSGRSITTGTDNIFVGYEAGWSDDQNNTVVNSIAIGTGTISTADNQVSLGNASMREIRFAAESMFKWRSIGRSFYIGPDSGNFTSTGQGAIAIGINALRQHSSGGHLVAIGHEAMRDASAAGSVVAIGSYSCMSGAGLTDCVAVGFDTLRNATSGVGATAVGHFALQTATSAGNNTGIGDSALRFTTTGSLNTAVGYAVMDRNATGSNNVALGAGVATYRTTGDDNVHIGFSANQGNGVEFTGGNRNVGVGQKALLNHVGNDVVAVGDRAGYSLSGSEKSVFIGSSSGENAAQAVDVSNSIAIGANTFTTKNNQIVLGDGDVDEIVIGGVTLTRDQLIALLALLP